MRCHYPDLASASDWLNQISHAARPIRSTTQIWVVTRHQFGFSALVSQTSFGEETSGSVARCRLFSPARIKGAIARVLLSGLEWYPHSFLINYSFQSILVEVRLTEWSPKGVKFQFSNMHFRPFHMEFPPRFQRTIENSSNQKLDQFRFLGNCPLTLSLS